MGLETSIQFPQRTTACDKAYIGDCVISFSAYFKAWESKEAKDKFIAADGQMSSLFSNAYAFVIFPNVGKGAIGVGGAAGNGIVFQSGNAIGKASMKQVTVGFQWGGQAYREVIFF